MIKPIIQYKLLNDGMEIQEILELKNKKSNCMFYKLSKFFGGAKNIEEVTQLIGLDSPAWPQKTARLCPGINNYIDKAVKIVLPTDVLVQYSSREMLAAGAGNGFYGSVDGQSHGLIETEFNDGGNLVDGLLNIKIRLPVLIRPSVDILMLDPFWHNGTKKEWNTATGVLPKNYTTPLNIILFVPFPKNDEKKLIKISQGTVIAYLYYGEYLSIKKNDSLVYRPDNKFEQTRRT